MDRTRLIMPVGAGPELPNAEDKKDLEKKKNGGDGSDGTGFGLDPLLIALLKKIPPVGSDWPGPQRVRWFRTFAMNVSQIYDADNDPVEMKIDLEKEAAN